MKAVRCRLPILDGLEPQGFPCRFPFFQPTRREFLKVGLAAVALPALPTSATASEQPVSFWFIEYGTGPHQIGTGRCWPVDDPAAWALANADNPILARAKERLTNVASCSDPQRVIRLVARRCKLNLIEVSPQQVVVHYWGNDVRAKPGCSHSSIGMAWRGAMSMSFCSTGSEKPFRKSAATITCSANGCRKDFPLELFMRKWERRDVGESDDWTAAPCTWAGFCWDGIERDSIPWAASSPPGDGLHRDSARIASGRRC